MKIHWSHVLSGCGLFLIISTEIGLVAVSLVWAAAGLLDLPAFLTTILYGVAAAVALLGCVLTVRLIHAVEPFFGPLPRAKEVEYASGEDR